MKMVEKPLAKHK